MMFFNVDSGFVAPNIVIHKASGQGNPKFKYIIFSNAAFGYAVDNLTLNGCWDYIADTYYNPKIREDIPPKPQNVVVNAGTLSAADPGEGYTLYVYQWDSYTTFTKLGPLSTHNTPGAGTYVLVTHANEGEAVSLPSGFQEIT